MAQVYDLAAQKFANGGLDWDTDDIRAVLLMSNTTADTENDAKSEFVNNTPGTDSFTTLDECDASGYSRDVLTTEAVSVDHANDRAQLTSDALQFTMTGSGTRDYVGVLLIKHVTNDTDSIPIAYIDFASAIDKAASQVDVAMPTNGWILLNT